jgi:hypothetical protein
MKFNSLAVRKINPGSGSVESCFRGYVVCWVLAYDLASWLMI